VGGRGSCLDRRGQIFLSVCLSLYPSVCQLIILSVCLSIFESIGYRVIFVMYEKGAGQKLWVWKKLPRQKGGDRSNHSSCTFINLKM
jgi:hypothetical protein